MKRCLIQSLPSRASTKCQERHDLLNEISNLKRDLQLNGYPQGFIDSAINSKGSSQPNTEEKPLGFVYIPYVKGVSKKFKRIGNRYDIRTIFKTKHKLRSLLMKPGQRELRNRRQGASIAFLVNVVEVTLAIQADL
jgi:hypothetical protein